jgi:hypothetical protein
VFRKPLLIATILTALFLLYIVLTNIFSPGEAYTPIISWVWAENIEWRYVWTTIFVFAYILFALTLILTAKNREKMVGEVGKMTLILGVVIFVIVPIADKLYQWLDKGIGYTRVYHSPTPTPAHATSTVTIRPQSEQTAVRPERQEIETVEAPPSPGVSRQVETWALQEYYFWVRPREPVYVRPIYPSHKGEWVFYTPQDYATGKLDFGWPIALEFQSPHGRPVEVTVRRSRSLK